MRYFIDTEFEFDARKQTVLPISIGMVCENGREFYAQDLEYDNKWTPDWIRANVLSRLDYFSYYRDSWDRNPFPGQITTPDKDIRAADAIWKPLHGIKDGIFNFIGDDTPEFWGDYAAFDYVVLSIIMGGFDRWPEGWPMFVHDLQQTPEGRAASDATQSEILHNALCDARAVKQAFEASRMWEE